MKKMNLLKLFFLSSMSLYGVHGLAQVGIGTNSPSASAQLEVSSSSKGFLPPRVTLTGTADVTTIASPATGLLVYNTATAGTSPANVTPGFYYYDGAKWQRIINQQPDATVEFDKATPTTPGVVFTPNTPNSKDYIYVSTVDNSQWTYNGTTYVTYTPPPNTPWYLSSGTNDAGSNKTSSIYRSGKVAIGGSTSPNATLDIRTNPTSTSDPGAGYLGIGTASTAPNTAGAGAIRYSTSSGGELQYSNGVTWNTLSSNVQKSVVAGYFSSSSGTGSITLGCTETQDRNGDFASSEFTAPRTGLYLVTVNILTSSKAWSVGEELNIGAYQVGTSTPYFLGEYFAQAAITTFGGTSSSCVVSLTAGQKLNFRAYNVGGFALYGQNYNQFSITEL